jgi:hypothetical protein
METAIDVYFDFNLKGVVISDAEVDNSRKYKIKILTSIYCGLLVPTANYY